MSQPFAIDDLLTAGLGFEMAGAYLLARGVLATPREVARRTVSYYDFNAPVAVAEAHDRADGMAGVLALTAGFGLQVVGYIVDLATHTDEHGIERAGAAAVIALGAASLVLLAWRLFRPHATKRFLVAISSVDSDGRVGRPSAPRLVAFGTELGEPLREHETTPAGQTEYARRVFGVHEVEPATESWKQLPISGHIADS